MTKNQYAFCESDNHLGPIQDSEIDRFSRRSGPLFHRWLPNGRDSAIKIEFKDEDAFAYLWFERRGFVDESGFIRYNHEKSEVDDAVIPRQGILEGGVLFGAVVMNSITSDEYEAVVNEEMGQQAYVDLGKRVVKRVIDPDRGLRSVGQLQRYSRLRDQLHDHGPILRRPVGFSDRFLIKSDRGLALATTVDRLERISAVLSVGHPLSIG